jgi:hypothetical protein
MVETFMTTIMGMLVGTTPLIIIQSSFALDVSLILFFLNNGIVIDDWWMTVRATGTYNLRTGRTILITIVYYHALILMTIWLLAASHSIVPLEGYLLILLAISLLDIAWCRSVCSANPSLEKEDYLVNQAWIVGDIVGAVVYLLGFMFLYLMQVSALTSALTFCGLYIIRRALDEGISRILLGVSQRGK